MDRSDMIFKLLTSLDDKQDKQSEVLTRVEADLKYHIKRTDLIQDSLSTKMPRPTLSQVSLFIGLVSTVIGLAIKFKVL